MPGGPNVDGVAAVASGANNLGSISVSPSLMTGQVDVATGWTTTVNALSILGDRRVDGRGHDDR